MALAGASRRDEQTPVRDQGPRPTCAVFAVTAAHEWKSDNGLDLSEEWCLWSAKRLMPAIGEATTVAAGLDGITADGHALEANWPYGSPAYPAQPPRKAAEEARKRPGRWKSLGLASIAEIRDGLDAGWAIILSLRFVVDAWYRASGDGAVDAPPGERISGGHAVLAVGITEDDEAIEFKNSWGADWGDGGYGYLTSTYWIRYGKCAYALEAA